MNKTIVRMQLLTVLSAGLFASVCAHGQAISKWSTAGGNWSAAANWSPSGVPGATATALFTNTGAATTPGTVDNIVDAGFVGAIGNIQYSDTNNGTSGFYHTTQIASGNTLTIATNLTVGTLSDAGSVCQVYAAVIGSQATLLMTNPSANLVVNQASASSGTHLATLNLTNLDNFVANIGRIQIGVANGVNRAEGMAAATRAAQLSVRGHFPHPYYWAGFEVVGAP